MPPYIPGEPGQVQKTSVTVKPAYEARKEFMKQLLRISFARFRGSGLKASIYGLIYTRMGAFAEAIYNRADGVSHGLKPI